MATRKNFAHRIKQRREEAAARQAEYDALTEEEKAAKDEAWGS
jgi:cell division protein FtsB